MIVLISGGFYIFQLSKDKDIKDELLVEDTQPTPTTEAQAPTAEPVIETQSYTNPKFKFNIQIPKNI